MKLKECYKGYVVNKLINGKMICLDTNNINKDEYEWYFKNGFSEFFENSENKINDDKITCLDTNDVNENECSEWYCKNGFIGFPKNSENKIIKYKNDENNKKS
jgi:hypothetical protein